MTRRQFSGEFKREAVHLLTVRGVSVAQERPDRGQAEPVIFSLA
jgi:transposase-like protein